ncbi:MAG: hypothetical protein IJ890_05610 [Clostridia bacterium]|nr:hypothetical protein [Clostridia bacterium]
MKDNLGYIKETMMNYFDESDNTSQQDMIIDENNIIDSNDVTEDFKYNQSSQQSQTEEDFDYTFLKVIVFLIFL